MMSYKIREFQPEDITSVLAIIRESLGNYDYKNAKYELENIFRKNSFNIYKFVDSFVLEANNKIIGYGGVWALRYDPDSFCMMDWLVIAKEYRRNGYGSLFMKFLLKRASKRQILHIYVETSGQNRMAIKFYRKHDFKQLCKIPQYYDDGSDLIMLLRTQIT